MPSAAFDQPEPVLWAASSFALMGAHSGMTPLVPSIEKCAPGLVRLVGQEKINLGRRIIRKIGRILGGNPPFATIQKTAPFYSEMGWALERRIRSIMRLSTPRVLLLDSLDDQFYTLSRDRAKWAETRFIGVSHQPPSWWRANSAGPEHFRTLDRMIVVSSEAQSYWQGLLGTDKVVFIPHGADVDFFVPGNRQPMADAPLRVIFCGNWFRDFETLSAVVRMIDERDLAVRFDLVIPTAARTAESLSSIANSPRVTWHAGLTDVGLRALYQQNDLMLQTLRDSTANNGIMEGMACGLPLVVTDIGGSRDYATPAFADFVPPRDPDAVVAALERWIDHRTELPVRGRLARDHVTEHFAWISIAERYVDVIRETMGKDTRPAQDSL
jgi:glycosyltransferase involved in cell wall biosynthesis